MMGCDKIWASYPVLLQRLRCICRSARCELGAAKSRLRRAKLAHERYGYAPAKVSWGWAGISLVAAWTAARGLWAIILRDLRTEAGAVQANVWIPFAIKRESLERVAMSGRSLQGLGALRNIACAWRGQSVLRLPVQCREYCLLLRFWPVILRELGAAASARWSGKAVLQMVVCCSVKSVLWPACFRLGVLRDLRTEAGAVQANVWIPFAIKRESLERVAMSGRSLQGLGALRNIACAWRGQSVLLAVAQCYEKCLPARFWSAIWRGFGVDAATYQANVLLHFRAQSLRPCIVESLVLGARAGITFITTQALAWGASLGQHLAAARFWVQMRPGQLALQVAARVLAKSLWSAIRSSHLYVALTQQCHSVKLGLRELRIGRMAVFMQYTRLFAINSASLGALRNIACAWRGQSWLRLPVQCREYCLLLQYQFWLAVSGYLMLAQVFAGPRPERGRVMLLGFVHD